MPKGSMADCVAYWGDDGSLKYFKIRIDNRLSWDATWESLIHEWAHAISWKEGHETVDDHDETWGLAYAHCYRETE